MSAQMSMVPVFQESDALAHWTSTPVHESLNNQYSLSTLSSVDDAPASPPSSALSWRGHQALITREFMHWYTRRFRIRKSLRAYSLVSHIPQKESTGSWPTKASAPVISFSTSASKVLSRLS